MNFNLKTSSQRKKGTKPQKKSNLGFGLNTRKKKASVLQDDDASSSSEGENDTQSRKSVNREIAAEQAAIRMRAEKAMSEFTSSAKSNIYDYDANYESFSSGHHKLKAEEKEKEMSKYDNQDKKESRYIATLMDKAKERKQEMEIITERKIAREQEAEGAKDEYIGKDKFITKGYKRVLEERNAWLEKDKKESKIEEQEDVSKRKGAGVMGLYSNLNVALGGGGDEKLSVKAKELDPKTYETNQGFQVNLNNNHQEEEQQRLNSSKPQVVHEEDEESVDAIDDELRDQAARAKTMEKIFNARDRYLERIGASQ